MSDRHETSPYENLARRFAAAVRSLQLYAADHPLQRQNLVHLADILAVIHATRPSIVLGVVGGQLVVADTPLSRGTGALAELLGRLTASGIERITVSQGVTDTELATFVAWVAALTQQHSAESAAAPTLRHITVGRIGRETEQSGIAQDMATLKRLYDDAAVSAEGIFESARTEGRPDLSLARGAIEGLAESIAQNRTALIALTAMKGYDNYTFTHMVNVSILAMAQAEALGITGQTLREFGLSALMHDIGKVRTPLEILQKSGPLTEEEFVIMKRHVVDGAEILRRTPGMPIMAPSVAFEHHLRVDGTGYPDVRRPSLNLATMLTGIADVYDAMRSQRAYQEAFPSDRILAVMKRNDGTQFDQHLVRRFVQLIGIYPPGTVVRLSTNEIAIVLQVHAPDPHRPRVRILQDGHGHRVPSEPTRHLWETRDGAEDVHVSEPLDAAALGIDPLEYL
ncbi:MAG: HD-GYP domain-containing protein [Acidobacteria bacterium]|nr:HD-GYP domain-containing protein [Acidobacteriota bacterium]